MFRLDSKAALVTGAGRGIGRAIALQLAAAGASLMVTDLDASALAETHALLPSGCTQFAGDITDPAFPQALIDRTVESFGRLDIIVNNAGYTWDSVIQKTTDEQFQAMLNIHVTAPFRVLRAASGFIREAAKREMAEGRRVIRKVVNITSVAGTDGGAGQAGYSSGKAAVIGLTRTMAKEWGRYNVNVNAVGFGLIATRLTQAWTPESKIQVGEREIQAGVKQATLDQAAAATPLGRLGTVEEAAGAVLFLCSPLSDFVTGEILMCTGGLRS